MSMKNSNGTIGNRSRDLPVCSAVPQPLRHRVVYTVPPDNEQKSARNLYRLLIVINWKQIVHLVGPTILIYYDARSTNSASCWSYYTDILRCTVNKSLVVHLAALILHFKMSHFIVIMSHYCPLQCFPTQWRLLNWQIFIKLCLSAMLYLLNSQ
jgi:hypothetical protein